MKTHEVEAEALSRAVSGQSAANYTAIVEGFTARGIAPADIRPRETENRPRPADARICFPRVPNGAP